MKPINMPSGTIILGVDVASEGVRGLLDSILPSRGNEKHDHYVNSIVDYLRKREFPDETVRWMEGKLKGTLGDRPLHSMHQRELWYLAKRFDEELQLKHGYFKLTRMQSVELNRIYMDALDMFSSHKLGHASHTRGHLG